MDICYATQTGSRGVGRDNDDVIYRTGLCQETRQHKDFISGAYMQCSLRTEKN